jgi:hypothetical protein
MSDFGLNSAWWPAVASALMKRRAGRIFERADLAARVLVEKACRHKRDAMVEVQVKVTVTFGHSRARIA